MITKALIHVLPAHLSSNLLLRFELRLLATIARQLNRSKVLASDLYEEQFFKSLIEKFILEYRNINKVYIRQPDLNMIGKPNDFIKLLACLGIQSIGQATALQWIEEMKYKRLFPYDKYYGRLITEILALSGSKFGEYSELITELDEQFTSVKEFYL